MPDDRLFHKRLGHSSKVNSLSDFEDLVWRQYVLSADDFGVMRYSAITLQADNDRLAQRPVKVVMKALERALVVGLIRTFEHQGRTFCFQHDWQNYQRVKYPRGTINPKPPDELVTQCSPDTRQHFAKHPGGAGRTLRDGSGTVAETVEKPSPNISEPLEHLARAGARETANTNTNTNGKRLTQTANGEQVSATEARSKRPIFVGQRFTVFEWMLDDLCKLLGEHTDGFDLHRWFFDLDAKATAEGFIVPQRDGGKWLIAQTQNEAIRRGLFLEAAPASVGKTAGNAAAMARFIARGGVQ